MLKFPSNWCRLLIALVATILITTCGDGGSPTVPSYSCTVTISRFADTNPHPNISNYQAVQTATGSGSGTSESVALAEARRQACAQLDLTSSERAQCERGQSPTLFSSGPLEVPLLSENERRCSGGTG